jgi:hypothetical protein
MSDETPETRRGGGLVAWLKLMFAGTDFLKEGVRTFLSETRLDKLWRYLWSLLAGCLALIASASMFRESIPPWLYLSVVWLIVGGALWMVYEFTPTILVFLFAASWEKLDQALINKLRVLGAAVIYTLEVGFFFMFTPFWTNPRAAAAAVMLVLIVSVATLIGELKFNVRLFAVKSLLTLGLLSVVAVLPNGTRRLWSWVNYLDRRVFPQAPVVVLKEMRIPAEGYPAKFDADGNPLIYVVEARGVVSKAYLEPGTTPDGAVAVPVTRDLSPAVDAYVDRNRAEAREAAKAAMPHPAPVGGEADSERGRPVPPPSAGEFAGGGPAMPSAPPAAAPSAPVAKTDLSWCAPGLSPKDSATVTVAICLVNADGTGLPELVDAVGSCFRSAGCTVRAGVFSPEFVRAGRHRTALEMQALPPGAAGVLDVLVVGALTDVAVKSNASSGLHEATGLLRVVSLDTRSGRMLDSVREDVNGADFTSSACMTSLLRRAAEVLKARKWAVPEADGK